MGYTMGLLFKISWNSFNKMQNPVSWILFLSSEQTNKQQHKITWAIYQLYLIKLPGLYTSYIS